MSVEKFLTSFKVEILNIRQCQNCMDLILSQTRRDYDVV